MDAGWQRVRNVLAVRLDNLGDVLLTTPAIHAIKETLPEARITLLAGPTGAQVADLDPDIDETIVYEAPWTDVWHRLPQDPGRELALVEELRRRAFDGQIIFTSYHQSSLPAASLGYLAGIPLRHAASIDGPGSLLTSRYRHSPEIVHEVQRSLNLVGALGFTTANPEMVLRLTAEDRAGARALLDGEGVDPGQGPIVVIHPGCTAPARTYPWGSYARVARLLAERMDCQIVFTGDPGEIELVERIRAWAAIPAVSLAGRTPFRHLAAVIDRADLLITNNTGPMHVASAVKTPVVVLFALTNPPQQWGPWRVPYRQLFKETPCAYCYTRICPENQECLRLVTPEEVTDAALDLLHSAKAREGAGAR